MGRAGREETLRRNDAQMGEYALPENLLFRIPYSFVKLDGLASTIYTVTDADVRDIYWVSVGNLFI